MKLVEGLFFIKFGGSLITNKQIPRTARQDVIEKLASELRTGLERHPKLKLLVGHGSGSFGHQSAAIYNTRKGVYTQEDWQGFCEVWNDARVLNQLVIEIFNKTGLPILAFPPSATVTTFNGKITFYDYKGIQNALKNNLIPVIYGDVVFDTIRGGTIVSTEELFIYLAEYLHPKRILLAGQEPGVWADYPVCSSLLSMITPDSLIEVEDKLRGSSALDVTGGMYHKVTSMLELIEKMENLEVMIFSGEEIGSLSAALDGEEAGTVLRNRITNHPLSHQK